MLDKIGKAFNVEQVDKTLSHKKVLYDLFIQRSWETKISVQITCHSRIIHIDIGFC